MCRVVPVLPNEITSSILNLTTNTPEDPVTSTSVLKFLEESLSVLKDTHLILGMDDKDEQLARKYNMRDIDVLVSGRMVVHKDENDLLNIDIEQCLQTLKKIMNSGPTQALSEAQITLLNHTCALALKSYENIF